LKYSKFLLAEAPVLVDLFEAAKSLVDFETP